MRRMFWIAACVSVVSASLGLVHARLQRIPAKPLSLRTPLSTPDVVTVADRFHVFHGVVHQRVVHLATRRVRLLARLIQAEAGDQSYPTQVAVGAVVVHRLRSPGFPHHLFAVINQPYQFSVVSAGTFVMAHPATRAVRAARAALTGANPVPGSLYFYNPTLPHGSWMNTLVGCHTVGALRFCAEPH